MRIGNRAGIAAAVLMSGALAASGLALAGGIADAAPSPPVDQLLGVNDSDVAVGFYTDAADRGRPVPPGDRAQRHQLDRGGHQRGRRRVLVPGQTGFPLHAVAAGFARRQVPGA